MSLLRLKDSIETPPGDGSHGGMGYRFTHPETGHQSRARTREVWYEKIDRYRRDNNLPPMPHEVADDQLCQLLPPGWCKYDSGESPQQYVDARVGVKDAINGTKVLIHWAVNGGVPVSQEKAERRARICANCHFAVPLHGCGACLSFMDYVTKAKGTRKTSADGELDTRACIACHCSAAAHVWVPIESLAQGVDDKMLNIFPSHCWKKLGVIEHRAAKAV